MMKHAPKYCTNNAQPSSMSMSAVGGGSAAALNPQRVYLFSVPELLHVRVRIRVGVTCYGIKFVFK